MNNLNKTNFFDQLQKAYPLAMEAFLQWIDKQKAELKWQDLFNAGYGYTHKGDHYQTQPPKFHELPFEFQAFLLFKYVAIVGNKFDPQHLLKVYKEMFTRCIADQQLAISKRPPFPSGGVTNAYSEATEMAIKNQFHEPYIVNPRLDPVQEKETEIVEYGGKTYLIEVEPIKGVPAQSISVIKKNTKTGLTWWGTYSVCSPTITQHRVIACTEPHDIYGENKLVITGDQYTVDVTPKLNEVGKAVLAEIKKGKEVSGEMLEQLKKKFGK